MHDLFAARVMSPGVETVTPGVPVARAAQKLDGSRRNWLAVIDQAGRLKGVFAVPNIRVRGTGGDSVRTVSDCMIDTVVTVAPQDTIQQAAEKMRTHDVNHVPVVASDETLLGNLSQEAVGAYLPGTRTGRSVPEDQSRQQGPRAVGEF
jgi:CBS domain-containing protein